MVKNRSAHKADGLSWKNKIMYPTVAGRMLYSTNMFICIIKKTC